MSIRNVVLFSGGRTSGFMLKRLLDSGRYGSDWITIFCNTGKERNETLDFVHEVEKRWCPVVWLEYCRIPSSFIPSGIFPSKIRNNNLEKLKSAGQKTHWFKQVNYDKASRNGEPFDCLLDYMTALPNVVGRACSSQLKIRTAMRYLCSLGISDYAPAIGIRKDESHRALQILEQCEKLSHPFFPLIEDNISESEVMAFWSRNDFDLKLKSHEGNCDLCFLKAKWKRIKLIRENPGMVDWWKNWEAKKGNGCLFRQREPFADLEVIARQPEEQEFCFTVKTSDRDIPCSCAEKGFETDSEP